MRRVTIKDVAAKAGVSITLVSKVVNSPRKSDGSFDCKVRHETAARIMEAVHELGYRPNRAAASLRRGKENRIGVILPDIASHFFADVARDIENVAYDNGYTVLFGSSDENPKKVGNLLDNFIADGVDGIIITPCCDCDKYIHQAAEAGIPIVITTRDIPSLNGVGRVLDDSVTATELALGHLLECGFRDIEMISTSRRLSNVMERERLYREFMARHSLEEYTSISHIDDNHKEESVSFVLEDVLRRGVQALYFPSGALPLLFLYECHKRGVNVPNDIAFIGYDGGKDYTLTSPSISQVMYSREEMARKAFGILRDMIDGKEIPETVRLKPIFLKGNSTIGQQKTEAPADRDSTIRDLQETVSILNKTIKTLLKNEHQEFSNGPRHKV